jgi:hypothetical protein
LLRDAERLINAFKQQQKIMALTKKMMRYNPGLAPQHGKNVAILVAKDPEPDADPNT